MRGTILTWSAVLVTPVCAAVLFAACSDEEPPPPGRTTAPPTSVTTTSAAPVPTPTLPAAAKADKAGAEAFVRYFWDVFNYTYESGDTKLLRSISDKGCKFCKSVIDYVSRLENAGLRARGGSVTVNQAVAPPAKPTDGLLVYTVVTQAAGQVVAADGTIKETSEARANMRSDALVRWVDDSWHVVGVSLGGPEATP
jgi:hypothetical protein